MGGCCEKFCPSSTTKPEDEPPERRRLLSSSSHDAGQAVYGSCTPPITTVTEQPCDRDAMVRDIIKIVENRVVDAGASEVNLVDNQQYTERSRYYADTVARRPMGPPVLPIILPRTCANPAAVIDAPTASQHELHSARRIARTHRNLLQTMSTQEPDDLTVPFVQT
ncbi:RING-box protein [Paragonimus westermani]|uniref:RING-box protein n=1 Tax=Paragonimus westermani TaxID=34504 RepID=A0A8T0DRF9_9TREM|nr:RING-box protein [Paragonimus westermani]